MDKEKIIKPLLLLATIVLFSSIMIKTFSRSETLAEYAAKNSLDSETETAQTAEKYSDKPSPEQEQAISHNISQDSLAQNDTKQDNITQKNATQDNNAQKNPTQDNKTQNNITQNDNTQNSAAQDNSAQNQTAPEHMKPDKDSASSPTNQKSEDNDMTANPNRVTYKNGFYYEPLSEEMVKRITGISYPVTESEKDNTIAEAINIVNSASDIQISYDDLCYMSVLHYNFHGVERTGELICNKAIAQDLVEIFYELYQNEYQIEQIRLIDEYSGDDALSMQDNNTSCFNYRVVDGTSSLSKHALGLAIDINPFFNPYVVFQPDGSTYISPKGSETYADRTKSFAYKIDENDLCYKLFKEHGFTWGGHWNSCKDYQHFQKVPD